jgi:hypothetical protein
MQHDFTRADNEAKLGAGALMLRGFALPVAASLAEIADIEAEARLRQMETSDGWRMPVAVTSAGPLG